MLIMNTLFFKGSWRRQYFLPENIQTNKFYTINNQTVNASFMRALGRFYYVESPELNAKILRIPYNVGEIHCPLFFSFFYFIFLFFLF